MKLICISTKDNFYSGCSITIQKVYDCHGLELDHWNNDKTKCVYIIDDNGLIGEYPKTCFMALDEYRNSKIEEILI